MDYNCSPFFIYMKYSNYIGIFCSAAIVATCFLPWVHISSLNVTLSGVNGKVSDNLSFGTQLIAHTVFAVTMGILFLVPKVGAKRANILIGAIQLSWAIKNFTVFTMCREGECPEKLAGMYILVFFSVTLLIMSLFPAIKEKGIGLG